MDLSQLVVVLAPTRLDSASRPAVYLSIIMPGFRTRPAASIPRHSNRSGIHPVAHMAWHIIPFHQA